MIWRLKAWFHVLANLRGPTRHHLLLDQWRFIGQRFFRTSRCVCSCGREFYRKEMPK